MQTDTVPLVVFYGDFLASFADRRQHARLEKSWATLANSIDEQARAGRLDAKTSLQARLVAHNISRVLESFESLSNDVDKAQVRLEVELDALHLHQTSEEPRRYRAKRAWPSADDVKPSKRSNKNLISTSTRAMDDRTSNSDSIRLWFLHHLADPYPTPLQKRNLSTSTGIPVPRLEAHLTNWRRRAGWSAILHKRCEGKKDLMAVLVKRVLSGEEKDPEVIKEVEGVQKYLRKEEEGRVGEWVYQLAELAKKSQAPSDDTIETTNDEQDADDASPRLAASSDASPSSTTTSDRSALLLQTHHSSDSSSPCSSLDSSSPPAPARQIIHSPAADAAFTNRTISAASSFSSLSASSAIVRATSRSTSTNSNTSSTSTTSGISSVAAASVALGLATETTSMGTSLRRRTSSVRSTAEGEIEYLAAAPTDGNFSFTPFSFFPSSGNTPSAAYQDVVPHGYVAMPGYQPVSYQPSNLANIQSNEELHHGIKRPADADSPTGSKVKEVKHQHLTSSGDAPAPWVFNHPLGPPTGFSLGTFSPSSSKPSKHSSRPVSYPVEEPAQDGVATFNIPGYPLAYPAAMWGTTAQLPLLPHMAAMGGATRDLDHGADEVGGSNRWALPEEHDFEPSFPGWA